MTDIQLPYEKPNVKTKRSFFIALLWLVMCSSGIVFFEPAPIDFGVMLLFVLGILLARLNYYPSMKFAVIFLCPFVVGNLISMLFAENTPRAISYFAITLYLMIFWLFFLGICNHYGDRAVKLIMTSYTISAVVSAFITVATYLNVLPFYNQVLKYGRGTGFFKDPNVFGPFLVPVCLYALSNFESSKKGKQLVWLVVYAVLTAGVLISFSRAAWGNFVVAHVVYFALKFVSKPSFKRVIQYMFFSGVIVLLLLYLMSVPLIRDIVAIRFAMQDYDSVRFANQDLALTLAINNPLGIGPGQFENWYAAHNVYLRVVAENGLIGFFGFILFVLASLFRSIRMSLKNVNSIFPIISASIIGILLNSLVIDSLHWRHFWLLLAVAWVSLKKPNQA